MYISIENSEKLDSLELSNDFIKDHGAIKSMLDRCASNLDSIISLNYIDLYLENDNEYKAVSLIFKYHSLYYTGDDNYELDNFMYYILQNSLMNYEYRHLDNYDKLDDYEHDKVVDAMRVLDNIAHKYGLWDDLRQSRVYRLLYLLMDEYENRVD